MLRILSVEPLLAVGLRITTKTGEQTTMSTNRFEEEFVGVVVNLRERVRVRLPPTVSASKVAGVDIRCHLHTTVAFDAVESALVTRAICNQTLLCPMANLHSPVLSNEVVTLFCKARRDLWFDLGDWRALHWISSDFEHHNGVASGNAREDVVS